MGKQKKGNFYTKQKEITQERAAQRSQQGHHDVVEAVDHGDQAEQERKDQSASHVQMKKSSDLYSVFKKMDAAELEESNMASMKPLQSLDSHLQYECSKNHIAMPKRPAYSLDDTKEELDAREYAYFSAWKQDLLNRYPPQDLSYFEQNLEVWRQLWRVVEMSDILLVIADARNPLFHIPGALYKYVVEDHGKNILIVLNKVDLVKDSTIVEAWKRYISTVYPGISICTFSCHPAFEKEGLEALIKENKIKTKAFKRYYRASGVLTILQKCREFVEAQGKDGLGTRKRVTVEWDTLLARLESDLEEREAKAVDAINRAAAGRGGMRQDKSSKARRRRQMEAELYVAKDAQKNNYYSEQEEDKEEEEDEDIDPSFHVNGPDDDDPLQDKKYITLGTIGQPNVGKSSILNALLGSKHVSVSKSPGHTKHFQTMVLAPGLRLCDCPGLVFPSLVAKQVQILSGVYSIAQVQDCVSVVRFLAERGVDLIAQLHLQHPDQERLEDGESAVTREWSAWDICEAMAIQRGFKTAKTGRPDVQRAANLILRMAVEGRVEYVFAPPAEYFDPSSHSASI